MDTKYVIGLDDAHAIHLAIGKLYVGNTNTSVISNKLEPLRKIEVKGQPLVLSFINGEDHIVLQDSGARVFAKVIGLWLEDESPPSLPENSLEGMFKDLLGKGMDEFERARKVVGSAWYDSAFSKAHQASPLRPTSASGLSKKAKDTLNLMLTCELVKKLDKFTKETPDNFENSQFDALFKEMQTKLQFIKSSDAFKGDVDYRGKVSMIDALLRDIFASAQIIKEKQPQQQQPPQEKPTEQSKGECDKKADSFNVNMHIDDTIARHGEKLKMKRNEAS
jgi:hypothetical protein